MSLRSFFSRSKHESERTLKRALTPYIGDTGVNISLGSSVLAYHEREIICVVTRVRDFDSLLARMPLREIGPLVNRYYALIAEAAMRSQGDVSQFCGSLIVVHFSTGREIEEGMMINTAITAFREAAGSLQSEFRVRLGIGMCRGAVLYGSFGSASRKAFSAFGPPLLCAEQFAAQDQLNVCERLARPISSTIDPSISFHPHWIPPKAMGSQ